MGSENEADLRLELEKAQASVALLEGILESAVVASKSVLEASRAMAAEILGVTAERDALLKQHGLMDIITPNGEHLYNSTHCRHRDHDACKAIELVPGVERKPAQCKKCAAPCRCWCHKKELLWSDADLIAREALLDIEEKRARLAELEAGTDSVS